MTDTLIKVEGVSKKFCRSLKKSLLYGMQDLGSELIGRRSCMGNDLRDDEFWAVDGVSFEVKRGECLGLIGPNGSGKTTMLRMLNGLIKPDKGRITMCGRVGALIALGAGFNPILTGTENVYAAGAVLGLSTKKIKEKYSDIVEFAELEEFMDTPVQHYSSGMQVRLGFAVAAQMDPDILLLDEVLAVGDMNFRLKCLNRILELLKTTAVVFVSHSIAQVSRIATKSLVLDEGNARYIGGDIGVAVEHYYSLNTNILSSSDFATGLAKLEGIEAEVNGVVNPESINYLDNMKLHIYLSVSSQIERFNITINIATEDMNEIASCSTDYDEASINNISNPIRVTLDMGEIYFNPGLYYVRVAILNEKMNRILFKRENAMLLRVGGSRKRWTPIVIKGVWKSQAVTAISK